MRCKSLILPDFSNTLTLQRSLSHSDKEILLKNIRYSLIVSMLALGLAGFSNVSFARLQTVAVKKQASKAVSARKKSALRARAAVPKRPSFGEKAGLHDQGDELSLKSSVAYVIDQDTQEVLFSKNDNAVLPIASITKLMTGVVIRESNLSMDEPITITQEDIDTEKGSSSRLRPGTTLTRGELLHLALMSSENRAAHALGRTYPTGLVNFVSLMNAKAQQLGMKDTNYAEPTGLSSKNQSSAKDLATLVAYAANDPTMRELTTSVGTAVEVGRKTLNYKSTNRLVSNPQWNIDLQKTGYISEAGQCLVMQAKIAGRKLVMVFLDSAGKFSRIADAERVRRWVELRHPAGSQT
jgi:D-alanyl-D-alanine endopeptidase (penicillin-binding protein 7)